MSNVYRYEQCVQVLCMGNAGEDLGILVGGG